MIILSWLIGLGLPGVIWLATGWWDARQSRRRR